MSSYLSDNISTFTHSKVKTKKISDDIFKVPLIAMKSMTSSRQNHINVVEDVRCTNEEKVEIFNKAIEKCEHIDELIRYHIDRATLNYQLRHWQNVLSDIDFIERNKALDTSIQIMKWKLMIQLSISAVRAQVVNSIHGKSNDIDVHIDFLRCIKEEETNEFLEGHVEKVSSKGNKRAKN